MNDGARSCLSFYFLNSKNYLLFPGLLGDVLTSFFKEQRRHSINFLGVVFKFKLKARHAIRQTFSSI